MDISVVIPLYNKESSIRRTLTSALTQTVAAAEVIVVDDGSTDRSLDLAKTFGTSVCVIEQRNAGPSAARNKGVKHARGSHILFVDGDDVLHPNAIEQHLACFGSMPDVDVSLGSFENVASGSIVNRTIMADRVVLRSAAQFEYLDSFSADSVIGVATSSICVSKKLIEDIGGWDEELHCWEVSDFLIRAALAARRTGLHREIGLSVHLSDTGQFGKTHANETYRLRFAEKIVGFLHSMPPDSRVRLLDQVRGFNYQFWKNLNFDAHHQLSRSMFKALNLRSDLDLYRLIGLLPVSCLRILHRLRYGTPALDKAV